MLPVQQFLIDHTFAELGKEHGVYPSFNKTGTCFSLNYDQIEAKENNQLACDCRGLILSREDGTSMLHSAKEINGKVSYDHLSPGNTRIVAFPMVRFFNYGQEFCAPINWDDPKLKAQEKRDGSLCICYFSPLISQWNVATRSCPEADIPLDNGIYTFRGLFEKALFETLGLSFLEFVIGLDKEITYCFELTTPFNRIVVKQNECRITFLAARHLKTLQELDIETVNVGSVPKIQSYSLKNINDILKFVAERDPLEYEGIVVCDSQFNRIKVKNAGYILLNKRRDYLVNDRAFLNAILLGVEDDAMSILPEEFQKRVIELKDMLKNYTVKIMDQYQEAIKQCESKKEFALLVQREKYWGAPMFKMFDKKTSDFKGFIAINRADNGEFNNGFLDALLSAIQS